jgi:simple sugar transport system permease protein
LDPQIIAAAFFALLLAFVCIRFKANEVVAGTGINILFLGLPAVLSGALFLSSGSTPQIPKISCCRRSVGYRSMSIVAVLLVALTQYVLYRTPFGLRLRSVGENPEAADAAGIRVLRMRYPA